MLIFEGGVFPLTLDLEYWVIICDYIDFYFCLAILIPDVLIL